MAIETGARFGPYEITGFVGAGGMGEVYQARDARLNRMVALKILPPELVANPERRQRFIQEAQLASALQHPHIVTIFDIGSANDAEYMAMELVRGKTLDTLIPNHGMRLTDALRYAVQIIDALAAAHQAGIVHRDLKPGNIMVTEAGQVKILDFGLATLVDSGFATSRDTTDAHEAPTMVETSAGMILGTVAYMSPEQAEGKKVDARSDIFSFGAILYEMLSGQRAFRGDSAAATLAAVLAKEPEPLTHSAPTIPQPVERLVSRCLRKDVTRRAQHASDVKLALEELEEDSSSRTSSRMLPPEPAPAPALPVSEALPVRRARPRMLIAAIAIAGVIVMIVAALAMTSGGYWSGRRTGDAAAASMSVSATPLTTLPGSEQNPTFSPDGTQVAYQWRPEGETQPNIYVQVIGDSGTQLKLTNDGASHGVPAWSPDGKSIALWHASQDGVFLCLVSPLGGPERRLLEWQGSTNRLSWSPDGQWIALSPVGTRSLDKSGIVLVAAADGHKVDWAAENDALVASREPAFSPDGRWLAYTHQVGDNTGEAFVIEVRNGHPYGRAKLVTFQGQPLHLPVWTADGQDLLFVFGSPTSNGGVARVDPNDGSGQIIAGLTGASTLALSHDGRLLAFARGGTDANIWRLDLQDPKASQRIAASTLWDGGAAYAPDGRHIAFSSNRGGPREIWVADTSGDNAQALTRFGGPITGTPRWSPDGRTLVFDSRPGVNSDVFAVPATGGPVQRLTQEPGEDARPAWSADGKWIYFSSDRSGRNEIWRMAPDGSSPTQITHEGGTSVVASPDGAWLYYKRVSSTVAPLFAIHPDGTGDGVFVPDAMPFMSFTASRSGLWFIAAPSEARPYWSVRTRRADGRITEAAKLDFQPDVLNISLSNDERYLLVTKPDTSGADLLLVGAFK